MKPNRVLPLLTCFFAILSGWLGFRLSLAGEAASGLSEKVGYEPRRAQVQKPPSVPGRPRGTTSGDVVGAKDSETQSRKADASVIVVSKEIARRLLETQISGAIKGRSPGPQTWSTDHLALAGATPEQVAKLQEKLDEISARARLLLRSQVSLVKDENGQQTYEIPDWSEQGGAGLRTELHEAVALEVGPEVAGILLNKLDDEAEITLFGEGKISLSFKEMENNFWEVIKRTESKHGSRSSSSISLEFPKEWLEVFQLTAPPSK